MVLLQQEVGNQVLPSTMLAQVRARRAALNQVTSVFAERLAPDFLVFQFVDTSEEGISKVLAWLLDPRSDHAQGERFLRAFLEWLELEWPDAARGCCRVQTEAPIPAPNWPRFIDILATGEGHAVAVENKIGAGDQVNQVSDYLAFLEGRFPTRHLLLYLTPTGCAPSEVSIPNELRSAAVASNRLVQRSYGELQDFLVRSAESCRSPRVRYFIEDFNAHISRAILGVKNMEETANLATEIATIPSNLAAALEIYETEREVKMILMRGCLDDVKGQAHKRGWVVEHHLYGSKDDFILIRLDEKDVWGFAVGFNQANYHSFFYGLYRSPKADAHLRQKPELIDFLNSIQQGRTADAEWGWPWWNHPQPHSSYFPFSRQWTGSKEFWLSVADSSFADMVVAYADEMQTHLRSSGILSHLR